jgi:uncharacterized membrane protein YhaH (DUF805 family)
MNYYLMVLQNFSTFSGRARRSEYWYFFLFNVIISFVLGFIGGLAKMTFISTIYTFFSFQRCLFSGLIFLVIEELYILNSKC